MPSETHFCLYCEDIAVAFTYFITEHPLKTLEVNS